jgi:hypothetical protein
MTPVVTANCLCPTDSTAQKLAKISNNLTNLFYLMSAGAFTGKFVNLLNCRCSDSEVLSTINNNLVNFFNWFSENGGVAVDTAITSWAELAAVATADLEAGAIKLWINAADGSAKIVQLRTGTDATDTGNGIQRPNDYADPGNTKVWYQA